MTTAIHDIPYLQILQDILDNGTWQQNRTGIKTLFIPGAMAKYDLRKGFPAFTSKQLAFKACKGELIGFLRGYTNAAQFRELGCNFWDQNANENEAWLKNPNRKGTDDLGDHLYGSMWRRWPINHSEKGVMWAGHYIDQVNEVMQKLYTNPTDRRMIISGWNPEYFDRMALPPCHVLYQFIADTDKKLLHLCMYQRSNDEILGVPMNVASASMFLTIMANLTGFAPATFTHFMADAHIYENHIDAAKEMIQRDLRPSPTLLYTGPKLEDIQFGPGIFDKILPEHFTLENYNPHPTIKVPMAV